MHGWREILSRNNLEEDIEVGLQHGQKNNTLYVA